ncbi:MAG TPA: pilus assembly protein TadG-related protein [Glaciibacter sp.]|nr:pilus assembly protein TadG-related protein [Glaciibacter sp.]
MRLRRPDSSSERGQVLLMTAAGLVVLMGVAALVVDLGFSWMLHRQQQNAADPAAIAAARHLKTPLGGATWNQAAGEADACFYARENGFFPSATTNGITGTGCVPANDPEGAWLEVHRPPISGPYSGQTGKVQVIIGATHDSFFGGIFGQSEANVTTAAVASNEAGNSNSSSLVALESVCQGGSAGDVDGGGEVTIFPTDPSIDGGYVHVNSPCGSSDDDHCQNGHGVGSGALSISGTLTTPHAYVNGACTVNGSNPLEGLQCEDVSPCLDEGAIPLGDPLAGLPEPRLANFPNGVCPNGTASTPASTDGCEIKRGPDCPADPAEPAVDLCTLRPGVYYGGWRIQTRVHLKLEPGMYILAGGGIRLQGGDASLEAVTNPSGLDARITIFSTDGPGCPSIGAQCQGDIRFGADQAFRAKALNAATCGMVSPQACPWKGILLWQDGTASNPTAEVHLGGQSSSVLSGTIYAPKARVEITGGNDTTGCSGDPDTQACLAIQIISYEWSITGGGEVHMPYDPSELYQLDLRGLVH